MNELIEVTYDSGNLPYRAESCMKHSESRPNTQSGLNVCVSTDFLPLIEQGDNEEEIA